MSHDDHEQLQRLFVRATARAIHRRDQWLLLRDAGAPEPLERRAFERAQEAVALVGRLGARHPLAPVVDALAREGPLHRRYE